MEWSERQQPYAIVAETSEYNKNWVRAGKTWNHLEQTGDQQFQSNHLDISCNLEYDGCTIQQTTVVKNRTADPVVLEQVSSAYIAGIGLDGIRPWYDPSRFLLHFCRMCWQGEGQWSSGSLPELGLYRASNHNPANAISFSSTGNMSTSMYYPLLYLEDKEMGQTWFFEILTSGNWHMELGVNGDGGIYVEMNAAWCGHDAWRMTLQPNEYYNAVPAVYGVVNGGFEMAVKERLRWHRKADMAGVSLPPVCFNDYMNCFWALPSDKKLLPLIDAAAEAGCEIFCIDDGWQKNGTGTWIPDDERFGSNGLQGVIAYIRKKGMRPGVWLEIESITHANEDAPSFGRMTREGRQIGCNGRYQYDFRCQEVRDYMLSIFDRLYAMGIRYIKNDFNQTAGIGCDDKDSYSAGLQMETLAFLDFIDGVRSKYPDLMIETCASGGMRIDNGALRHFHLCSSSDQEFFWNNPSIVTGMLACIQPEKCGIWSYPYALPVEARTQPVETYFGEKNIALYKDGERTVFNMVNAMLGVLYLSGHIEMADEKNRELIREGVFAYKQIRKFLTRAYPVYLNGMLRISEEGMYAFGLTDSEKLLVAVWKIGDKENVISIDLNGKIPEHPTCRVLYPKEMQTKFHMTNGMLTVKLSAQYSGRLFIIDSTEGEIPQ